MLVLITLSNHLLHSCLPLRCPPSSILSSCSSSSIYLGILGFGLSILFCTTFCRLCQRIRQDRIEREEEQNSERNGPSIYFIPFSRRLSQQDSEDEFFGPRGSQEPGSPPQYNSVYNESPPPYNEVIVQQTFSLIPNQSGHHTSAPFLFFKNSISFLTLWFFLWISAGT